MNRRSVALACSFLIVSILSIAPAQAVDPNLVASIFSRFSDSSLLANPAVAVIDVKTGETVFEKNATSSRKPASVIKLLSGTATLEYLDLDSRFTTVMALGVKPKSLVIRGELDPWISFNNTEAIKMHRTSMLRLAFNGLSSLKAANNGSARGATIYYSGIYSRDLANFKVFFKKRGYTPEFKRISATDAIEASLEDIVTSQSPTVQEILNFTLTWSDNLLAERLARLASVAAGNSLDDEGVARTFDSILNNFGIDTSQLIVGDASGLSADNRISARLVAQLLIKIKNDPKYLPLINALPIGGKSGTLVRRFVNTAPQAVGLVQAKTGTIRGAANLAGFVQAGDREYAFVILADRLHRTSAASSRARDTVDRILGKIASPIFPELLPLAQTPEPTPLEANS